MPTPTYTLIQEQVLGSAAATVTFSSIPGTYKDLVLEVMCGTTTGTTFANYTYNGDTGSNYSFTQIYGDGSTASSNRFSSVSNIGFTPNTLQTSISTTLLANIQSYSNTNVYKTSVHRAGSADNQTVSSGVGLWRNTAAITSITVKTSANNFQTGSTFRLWGVAG